MGAKQFQRPRLNLGKIRLIRVRKFALKSRRSYRVAVVRSAFIRRR